MSTNNQRVAVVTGASSGIGKEAAKALAARGLRIIAIGRDPVRSETAAKEIRAASSGAAVTMLQANLAIMVDVVKVAKEIATMTDRIDILLNNAGGIPNSKVLTPEGLEENFASNHLGPFLLTHQLLPLLRRAAATSPKGSVRIINTASDASEMIPHMPWDDLQLLKNFNAGLAYCRSKLANVLFARGLAKRLANDGIVAHSVHPGLVDSNFFSNASADTRSRINMSVAQTPEQGADTLIWLATANEPGLSSGGYFYQRKPKKPNPLVDDDSAVERLWSESEKIISKIYVG